MVTKVAFMVTKVAFMVTKSCLYGYKKLPLKSQMHCPSKVQTPLKRVLKRFIKDIKKFGAIFPSQIQETKGKQPQKWLLFIYKIN